MKQLEKIVTRVLQFGTLSTAIAFIGATLIQIYARFFMESAPSWTEEAARMFFIYAMSFAAGLALKENYYVHLDIIYKQLSLTARKRLDLGILLLISLLFGIVGWFSLQFIYAGIPEKSPSMGVSMSFSFSAVFVMAAGITIFSILKLARRIR